MTLPLARSSRPLPRQMLHAAVFAAALVLSQAPAVAQTGGDAGAPPMAMGGRMVRGTVTAIAADRLTLKTESGDIYQVVLTPNTQVRKGREQLKLADLHAGDGVGAMGEVEPATHTLHALFLAVIDAEQVRRLREEMGKSYIAGKVTAIDETKLTILRSDNVSQVIEVDEDTAFRRGGRGMGGRTMVFPGVADGQAGTAPRGARPSTTDEALTLADIKVGDTVVGPGSLQHGVFIPRELGVLPQGMRGGRRQGAGTPAASEAGK